jgi:hypothetical protein
VVKIQIEKTYKFVVENNRFNILDNDHNCYLWTDSGDTIKEYLLRTGQISRDDCMGKIIVTGKVKDTIHSDSAGIHVYLHSDSILKWVDL